MNLFILSMAICFSLLSINANAADGKEVYKTACAVCHKSGLNAAPKFGNKAFWTKRLAKGKETVYANSINGIRNMPPRGGIPSLTDEEVIAAVDFIVRASGGWPKE